MFTNDILLIIEKKCEIAMRVYAANTSGRDTVLVSKVVSIVQTVINIRL